MKTIGRLPVKERLLLRVDDNSNLVVKGTQGREDGRLVGSATVDQREEETVIEGHGSLVLSVPAGTALHLEGAPGEVVLKGVREVSMAGGNGNFNASGLGSLLIGDMLHGNVAIKRMSEAFTFKAITGSLTVKHGREVAGQLLTGSAALRDVGAVHIDRVEGDLAASRLESVHVERISGTCALSKVEGAVTLERVLGDLSIDGPGPSVAARAVNGDVSLSGRLHPGGTYDINSNGDVELQVEGNVRMTVRAGGEIELGDGLQAEEQADGTSQILLGEPDDAATLLVEAQGDIRVNRNVSGRRGKPFGYREDEPDIGVVVEEVMEEAKRAGETVRRDVRRAMQEMMEGSLAGEVAGATVRSSIQELLSALRPYDAGAPDRSTEQPTGTPPSEEELQMVLKMVEEGTITPEEADTLIEAMG